MHFTPHTFDIKSQLHNFAPSITQFENEFVQMSTFSDNNKLIEEINNDNQAVYVNRVIQRFRKTSVTGVH